MSRDLKVSCTRGQWTQLTDTDETGDVTIILLREGKTFIRRAAGTQPSTEDGAILIAEGDGWSEATIAEKFPGGTGARLWAFPVDNDVEIYFSSAA